MGKTYSTLRNMDSIITKDLVHCIHCGRVATDCHHICEGSDKRWSEEFKLMIPMCHGCHMELHNNSEMNYYYKREAQEAFLAKYPDKRWLDYFRKNYI